MKIRFYRRDTRWFADLPAYIEAGGTEEDCEMVSGADTWLDMLSNYQDSVTVSISDKSPLNEFLVLYNKDEFGGTYIAHSYKENDVNHVLWLCNVTLFIFGQFPDKIYYQTSN